MNLYCFPLKPFLRAFQASNTFNNYFEYLNVDINEKFYNCTIAFDLKPMAYFDGWKTSTTPLLVASALKVYLTNGEAINLLNDECRSFSRIP
jgi:hypothetical protein